MAEILKCWTCEPGVDRGGRKGCKHTSSAQGQRPANCMTWFQCFINCNPEPGRALSSYDNTIMSMPPTPPPLDTTTTQKKIHRINISKNFSGYIDNTIPQSGGVETIEIIGDPGAGFSLTLKDSNNDCSILRTPLDNVSIPYSSKGFNKYSFTQTFPSSPSENKYDLTILPSGGSILGDNIPKTTPTRTIKQYVNPLITFSTSTGTSKAFSISNTTDYPHPVSIKGEPNAMYRRRYSRLRGSRSTTGFTGVTLLEKTDGKVDINFQITKSAAGYLYVFKQPTNESWVKSTKITKTVNKEFSGGGRISVNSTSDIKKGMEFRADVSSTRALVESKDTTDCNKPSNTLVLSSVKDIYTGSTITSSNFPEKVDGEDLVVVSIDEPCKTITIDNPVIIPNGALLTFTHKVTGLVKSIIDHNYIEIGTPDDSLEIDNYYVKPSKSPTYSVPTSVNKVPVGTSLNFDIPDDSIMLSNVSITGSGATAVYMSGNVIVDKFGMKDVTMDVDLDNLISYKPNAYDQNINVVKNHGGFIVDLFTSDRDANIANKTPSIVTTPTHGSISYEGTISAGVGLVTYTPTTNYTGPDFFEFKVNDGTTNSDTKKINITVI